MASIKDKLGRPIVVVTGLGVVTSLGAGKTDNWKKLTAGESGIRAISRFSTEGLRTRIAGTVDFLGPQESSAALSEKFADLAAAEAIAQSGVGTRGDFPGPLFLAVPPIEIEWPQRLALAGKSGANDKVTYDDILTRNQATAAAINRATMQTMRRVRSSCRWSRKAISVMVRV